MKPGKTGITRIKEALGYSLKGLKYAWKNEEAFRQECILAIVLIPVALVAAEDVVQKVLLIIPIFIVLIVELINSAIEAAIDRFGDEFHELSGAAKDIGSAAVTMSLILLGFIWLLVLTNVVWA